MSRDEIISAYIPSKKHVGGQGRFLSFEVGADEVLAAARALCQVHNLPLKTMTATDDRTSIGAFTIWYIFGVPKDNYHIAMFLRVSDGEFPSLASHIHKMAAYELLIYSMFGLVPKGHPDLKRVILHSNISPTAFPLRKDYNANERVYADGEHSTLPRVEGEGIYEISVGPVHAGIIEPGHFQFSVAGEEVVALAAELGYVHKGSEKLFETLPIEKKLMLAERISGDSSFSHALAFTEALEQLAEMVIPKRAAYIRVILAELERLANHFNDIGFILMDTAYTFGGSNGARLREMIMRWNERLSGSRFLRGANKIGGVSVDISPDQKRDLLDDMAAIKKDFSELASIAGASSSVAHRLEDAGVLDPQIAKDHGVVGIAARACGFPMDARNDYPYAAYAELKYKVITKTTNDVAARYYVRVEEVFESIALIQEALERMPEGELASNVGFKLKLSSQAVGIVEGWRGDIVYFVATDSTGAISRVNIRDPSMPNWTAIPYAVQGNVVLDFPLVNKSFNLSYSGNDL